MHPRGVRGAPAVARTLFALTAVMATVTAVFGFVNALLGALSTELSAVTRATVHPAHVSLWLREQEALR